MTGSGTALDPWTIWDVNDLQDAGNGAPYLLSEYYQLGQDIDASVTVGWNGGQGFIPIGNWGAPFTGQFNGQNFTIDSLYINRPGSGQQALFGRVRGNLPGEGRILNVKLTNAYVYGGDDAGILVGQLWDTNSYVYNCHSGGQVFALAAGNIHDGGLIGGVQDAGTVRWCSSSAYVEAKSTGSGVIIGGLIGSGTMSLMDQCFATGNVRCTGCIGGADVGGLMGAHGGLHWHTHRDCYARGDVSGGNMMGGLIGDMWNNNGLVDNCYSTGAVAGAGAHIGGLIGRKSGGAAVTSSFWDVDTSGQVVSAGGTGRTTAQMKTKTTFTGAGWDFVNIWGIDDIVQFWNDGYPYLLWYTPADIVVVVPNGGEHWHPGSTYTILWTHIKTVAPNVSIELLNAGVLDEVIAASAPIGPEGGGNYDWTIDPGKTPGNHYRVRVSILTTPLTDTSDNDFSITDPAPKVAPVVVTLPATEIR
jgi:hypothetical protein